MNQFKHNEQQSNGFEISLATMLDDVKFNDQGLVPAIAQQYDTKEVRF